jgi:hypothetical protein
MSWRGGNSLIHYINKSLITRGIKELQLQQYINFKSIIRANPNFLSREL